MQLYLTELEEIVLKNFLNENGIEKYFFGLDFEDIKVTDRRITGSGYIVDLSSEKDLQAKGIVKYRGGQNIVADVNSGVRVGFVIYADDGKLNAIEGYTLGEPWPKEITNFTVTHLPSDGGQVG